MLISKAQKIFSALAHSAALVVGVWQSHAGARAAAAIDPVQAFLQKYCIECHDADTKKGGLDLSALKLDLDHPASFNRWVSIHDRSQLGEMPPKKKARPDAKELRAFTNSLNASLILADQKATANNGRAVERRLNRFEFEETLRDLFSLPYLEVKSFLPEDRESHGFNKVGEALDVSHVQMSRYLTASEFALREAMAPQVARPQTTTNRFYAWDQREIAGKIHLEGPVCRRTFPLIGTELQRQLMTNTTARAVSSEDPARREMESMAVVVSTYEPTEIRFGGFRAPFSGKYRLRFSTQTIWMTADYTKASKGRRSEPVTIYADTPPRLLRKLGSFDAEPDPTVRELDVWLLAGETIRPDAARFFRARPPDFRNPLATSEGMPALAFRWMEVEGPLIDQWPPRGHQLLFGNLAMTNRPALPGTGRGGRIRLPSGVDVVSASPEIDARKLIRGFMDRAYRTPVKDEDVNRFLDIFRGAQKAGHSFTDSMLASYTGVLCSPTFLYLAESPGRLDDRALADRLSYFLWNSAPDETLRAIAARGELHRPKILKQQTERLLNDQRSRRFVNAFLDYWLDLRLIAGTAPDAELYPDYQLDDLLVESMIDESQMFFSELIKQNLGISNLVSSKFAMLNERLATLYGVEGVEGVALRPVSLSNKSVRGGLLTQASVLKVTANGTTTSPVKRGAWIMSRILGKPPPPPPASVPAVEPDTRGATTIREQLAKHRTQESCAACHKNIDPAGFALESFDVMGAWRERYRSEGEGEPVRGAGHNGLLYHFRLGPTVDASGELPDGTPFRDVRELKELLLKDKDQLARNMIRQLAVYATGAPIHYSDRETVEKILAHTRSHEFRMRDLIHEIVQSEMFLKK